MSIHVPTMLVWKQQQLLVQQIFAWLMKYTGLSSVSSLLALKMLHKREKRTWVRGCMYLHYALLKF